MAAKKKDNPLSSALTVRLTREQRTKLHALAIKEGYESISEAIRALADAVEEKPSGVSSNGEV